MNVSNEVASLESMVESLTSENKILTNTRVINECELAQLRLQNHKLQAERDQAIETAAQLKVILDQAGAAIVHGMKAFQSVKRASQEAQLTNGEDKPLFLEKATAEEQLPN